MAGVVAPANAIEHPSQLMPDSQNMWMLSSGCMVLGGLSGSSMPIGALSLSAIWLRFLPTRSSDCDRGGCYMHLVARVRFKARNRALSLQSGYEIIMLITCLAYALRVRNLVV